jgi:hypothetical protein
MLFHRLRWPVPADYLSDVTPKSIRFVQAIKEYQRDHGQLPSQMEDLMPAYIPLDGFGQNFEGVYSNGQYEELIEGSLHETPQDMRRIFYDFSPGNEGWRVEGAYVSGRMPLPLVTIPPQGKPNSE